MLKFPSKSRVKQLSQHAAHTAAANGFYGFDVAFRSLT